MFKIYFNILYDICIYKKDVMVLGEYVNTSLEQKGLTENIIYQVIRSDNHVMKIWIQLNLHTHTHTHTHTYYL